MPALFTTMSMPASRSTTSRTTLGCLWLGQIRHDRDTCGRAGLGDETRQAYLVAVQGDRPGTGADQLEGGPWPIPEAAPVTNDVLPAMPHSSMVPTSRSKQAHPIPIGIWIGLGGQRSD